jgi:hypothetical protein
MRTYVRVIRRADAKTAKSAEGGAPGGCWRRLTRELLKLGDGNVALLEQIMGCTRDEARAVFESERVLPANSERAAKKARASPQQGDGSLEKRSFAGYSTKRLMGLEPTTFCMASRP